MLVGDGNETGCVTIAGDWRSLPGGAPGGQFPISPIQGQVLHQLLHREDSHIAIATLAALSGDIEQ